jgi:hypothetical protein
MEAATFSTGNHSGRFAPLPKVNIALITDFTDFKPFYTLKIRKNR